MSSLGLSPATAVYPRRVEPRAGYRTDSPDTHRYVRHQETWLRRNARLIWFDVTSPDWMTAAKARVRAFLNRSIAPFRCVIVHSDDGRVAAATRPRLLLLVAFIFACSTRSRSVLLPAWARRSHRQRLVYFAYPRLLAASRARRKGARWTARRMSSTSSIIIRTPAIKGAWRMPVSSSAAAIPVAVTSSPCMSKSATTTASKRSRSKGTAARSARPAAQSSPSWRKV